VLRALGRSDTLAHSSLRLTLGRLTTRDEIDRAVSLLREQIGRLRELSPLWEMREQGTLGAWAEHC
jgi:cysteine desulfurase